MAKSEHEMLFRLAAQMDSSVSSSFNSVQQEMSKLIDASTKLNQQQADISAYQKQASAVDSTKSKLTELQTELKNVQNALSKTGDATDLTSSQTVSLQNQEARLTYNISETSRKLTEQQEKLNTMGTALENAGIDTNNLGSESQRLATELDGVRDQMDQVGQNSGCFDDIASGAQVLGDTLTALGVAELLSKVTDAMKECSDAAMDFETAMASVRRTVGGSDEYIDELASSFEEMSTTMPITAEELASVATTAGQLGIAQDDVEEFTEVMAMLGTTTDLTADEAATMLAQFSNITGVTEYDRLGSTVAELGDATATTATKVVEMSQGMAAAASVAGMSSTDILAISAAVGSLGIESQAGSTAMSTLISTLYKAVESGGDSLDQFASVANMSAEEFAAAWEGDPVRALDAFIQGLNDTERNGESAIMVLDDLGITNVRQTKAILGLAEAGDLLSTTIDQANAAWEENTALQEKADVMYDTTESQLTMMQNAFTNLKVAIGDNYTPALEKMYEVGTQALGWATDFVNEHPALISAVSAATVAFTGLTAAVTAFNAAKQLASKISLVSLAGGGAAIAAFAAVAVAIGAVVAAVESHNKKIEEATEAEYAMTQDTKELAAEIEELQAEYDALVDAGEGTSAEAQELKAQIAELSAEFDNNAQSVTELIDEINALAEESGEAVQQYNDNMAAIDSQEESATNLADRLEELQGKENLTATEQAEMASIVNMLNDSYADLGLTLDSVSGSLSDSSGSIITTDDIKAMAQATAEQDRYNEAVETYGTLSLDQADLQAAASAALHDYDAAEEAAMEHAEMMAEALKNGVQPTQQMIDDQEILNQHMQDSKDALDLATGALNDCNQEMQDAASIIDEYNAAQEEYAESTEAQMEAIQAQMDTLQAEYDEYYQATLDSIQGTFSIWETAEEVVAVSVENQIAAMQSQIDYWTEYEENVQLVTEALNALDEDGYDTTNARAYFEELQSDPEESAAAMAGWADAISSDSESAQTSLMEAGDKFAELNDVQQSTADAATELATDFSSQMEELENAAAELEQSVEEDFNAMVLAMDRSGEAYTAGMNTVNNYYNAVSSMNSQLYNAGLSAGQSYIQGLNASGASTYSFTTGDFGYYASGTESAPPGWAWVGEEGPELMFMRGGEEILSHSASDQLLDQVNAMETKYSGEPLTYAAASGGETSIEVNCTFNISGSENAEEISETMMSHIQDRILDAIEQAQIDQQRRAFT